MFEGFSKQTVEFFEGIRDNNTKEWFLLHKEDYKKNALYPVKEFAEAIFEPFADNPNLHLKTCTIYRDAQCAPFTHYRENLWICIRHESMYWARNPTLFCSISHTGATFGFTLWIPEPRFMDRFRDEITDRPNRFLNILNDAEKKTGITLSGKEYKRPKPGFTPENERFFRLKSIEMFKTIPVGKDFYSKNLVNTVTETLTALLPINEYFYNLINSEKPVHKIRTVDEFEW